MKPLSISPTRSYLVCDFLLPRIHAAYLHTPPRHRYQSSLTTPSTTSASTITKSKSSSQEKDGNSISKRSNLPPLSVLPTPILLRTLMITTILSSPRLLNVCLPLMDRMSRTKSWLFNPDRNPVLHRLIRIFFYDHFCAGENATQISKTIATMKNIGLKGVILGYGREIVADEQEEPVNSTNTRSTSASNTNISTSINQLSPAERAVESWKEGNLTTLSMLHPEDILAIKFTGAGPMATHALLNQLPPPERLRDAIQAIALQAKKQNTRFWIDAEQDCYQTAIDMWTLDLMRQFNSNSSGLEAVSASASTSSTTAKPPLVYTTMQAYLVSTPTRISKLLTQSLQENFSLGIKLVRGAYIASEPNRATIIHATKADTDNAYNTIVEGLLTRRFEGLGKGNVSLMLASHNLASVQRAWEIYGQRRREGKETVNRLEFAQLQGMADDVSCGLVIQGQGVRTTTPPVEAGEEETAKPRAYKCLCWGSVQECMQFLVRRAVENRGAVERIGDLGVGLRREVWRRMGFGSRV